MRPSILILLAAAGWELPTVVLLLSVLLTPVATLLMTQN